MRNKGLPGANALGTTGRKTALAAMLGSVFMVIQTGALLAQPAPATDHEMSHVVAREEFYYYDAHKMRTPLAMSRSFALKFKAHESALGMSHEEYLKRYRPNEIKKISGIYQRAEYQLIYMPTTTVVEMVATIKRATNDANLDVAPVFIVDGMEAVVDGIYIEIATPVSREFILKSLEARFGRDALIHELTPEGTLWHVSFSKLFFLGGEKHPLNMLVVANILSNSDAFVWIKRAFPKFHFLRNPVLASLTVTPVSGTVGEKRMATLAIQIFGKPNEVVIADTDIPEFFQGKFTPLYGGKPPEEPFRQLMGAFEKRPKRQVGPNEWLIEHAYGFGLHAPEKEWTFSGMEIPYTYKGKPLKAEVTQVTFLVRPHLDEKFSLDDAPEAPFLSMAVFPGFSGKKPEAAQRWFDVPARFVGARGVLSNISIGAVMLGSFAFLALVGSAIAPSIGAAIQRRRGAGSVLDDELATLFDKAGAASNSKIAFQHFHDALSLVLHVGFPGMLRKNATYQNVKAIRENGPRQDLMVRLDALVNFEELFDEIESRQDPHFGEFDDKVREERYTLLEVRIQDLAREVGRYVEGGRA